MWLKPVSATGATYYTAVDLYSFTYTCEVMSRLLTQLERNDYNYVEV